MLIFLVGFMGSGKSSVGMELAKLLKFKFIDTDELIEQKEKRKISSVFKTDGEDYFRILEQRVLSEIIEEKKTVVATGGGFPCYFNNMTLMNERGVTIYLETSERVLFHRLIKDKDRRPMINELNNIDLMEFIASTLKSRRKYYEQSALTVEAEKINAIQIKEMLIKLSKDLA